MGAITQATGKVSVKVSVVCLKIQKNPSVSRAQRVRGRAVQGRAGEKGRD